MWYQCRRPKYYYEKFRECRPLAVGHLNAEGICRQTPSWLPIMRWPLASKDRYGTISKCCPLAAVQMATVFVALEHYETVSKRRSHAAGICIAVKWSANTGRLRQYKWRKLLMSNIIIRHQNPFYQHFLLYQPYNAGYFCALQSFSFLYTLCSQYLYYQ